ncbi:MAG: hypothetical protein JOS17DRAFT_758558 [Linnemannia elongata]|nr:MAG: hypothetical protein JOS17DRAFT_758558 [Linnemannia elongata]
MCNPGEPHFLLLVPFSLFFLSPPFLTLSFPLSSLVVPFLLYAPNSSVKKSKPPSAPRQSLSPLQNLSKFFFLIHPTFLYPSILFLQLIPFFSQFPRCAPLQHQVSSSALSPFSSSSPSPLPQPPQPHHHHPPNRSSVGRI